MKKRWIILLIIMFIVTGCGNNNETENKNNNEPSLSLDNSLFCNVNQNDLKDCIAFYEGIIRIGNFGDFEFETNTKLVDEIHDYEIKKDTIESDIDISYDKASETITYNDSKYEKRDFNLVKEELDIRKKLAGSTGEASYSYCTDKYKVGPRNTKYNCYNFNFDETFTEFIVAENGTYTYRRGAYGFKDSEDGKQLVFYVAASRNYFLAYYKFDGNDLIISYNPELGEKNITYTKRQVDEPSPAYYKPLKVDEAGSFSDGLAPVRKGSKWGYIDKTGKLVIDYRYDAVSSFSEGLAAVRLDDRRGYIDKTGKVVIDFDYDFAYSFSEGLAGVMQNGKYGFINKSGEVVIDFKYDNVGLFSDGLAAVTKDYQVGYIDNTGKLVLDYQYDDAEDFEDGIALVRKGYEISYIKKNGESIIDYQYSDAIHHSFSDGLGLIEKDDKSVYIDEKGKEVLELSYQHSGNFHEGLAAVQQNDKWGYVNKEGKLVIDFKYDSAGAFSEGLAAVEIKGKIAYIDTKGRIIIGSLD